MPLSLIDRLNEGVGATAFPAVTVTVSELPHTPGFSARKVSIEAFAVPSIVPASARVAIAASVVVALL